MIGFDSRVRHVSSFAGSRCNYIRVFSYTPSKILLIRFGVHNIFFEGVSRGSERAETYPLIRPWKYSSLLLTEAITIAHIFQPRWKMDESAGWCVSKRSLEDLRGWDPVGSLRAAIYETGVRNLPEPESVSSSAYQRTAQRGAENARGMRFNSGAFPSSRVGFSCLCTYAHTTI